MHAKPYFPARGSILAFQKLLLDNSSNSDKDILSALKWKKKRKLALHSWYSLHLKYIQFEIIWACNLFKIEEPSFCLY